MVCNIKDYPEQTLRGFVKNYSLPIQIYNPDFIEYYIELYDEYYDTKRKYREFQNAVSKFNSINIFEEYKHNLTDTIIHELKSTEAYKKFMETPAEHMYEISPKVCDVPFCKTVNIYTPDNHNKYFISIDLRRANYQALKFYNPDIVFNTPTFEHILAKYGCEYEYFLNSKNIRQVIFGNLDMPRMSRITRIERFLTQNILKYIIGHLQFKPENVAVFTTDEIILKLSDNKWFDDEKLDRLKILIEDECSANVHVENFKLNYIGNKFYVKEHKYDLPTFKGGSSIYFPQAYKHYTNQPLSDMDLCFNYEGQIARFLEPLKWDK